MELACGGRQALELAAVHRPDLVLLAIVMPGMDGYETCRRLGPVGDPPVIFVTRKDDPLDRVVGLELGAADYVAKPFNPREVVARVKSVLRRIPAGTPRPDPRIGARLARFEIHPATHEALICDRPLDLTPTEFELLWLLVSRPRIVFSRDQIISSLRDSDGDECGPRTVDTHVKHLRRKIAEAGCSCLHIETVWGIGYRLVVSDPCLEASSTPSVAG